MKPLYAITKQLFGARYERIMKSLFVCLIIFCTVYAAQIKTMVAPFILFLSAAVFSLGVMWRALGSGQNAEIMTGLFMLPFGNKRMMGSYLLAFGSYTVITKTLPLLILLFTVDTWSIAQMVTAVLCACNGCALAATWRVMITEKNIVPVVLWGFGIISSIFLIKPLPEFCGITAVSIMIAVRYLLSADVYTFYCPVSPKKLISTKRGKRSVLLYLLRYLMTNKSYLTNTVGLWAIACFLPLVLGQFGGLNVMPLGFAILSLNTPICILLSCDPELEQAVRALPKQVIRFGSSYCLFIFAVNMSVDSIYLISWQLRNGGVLNTDIMTAAFFALQSAVLSVVLEWRHPIRNWKIENDLWHHPRKYIVPLLMLLVAVYIMKG